MVKKFGAWSKSRFVVKYFALLLCVFHSWNNFFDLNGKADQKERIEFEPGDSDTLACSVARISGSGFIKAVQVHVLLGIIFVGVAGFCFVIYGSESEERKSEPQKKSRLIKTFSLIWHMQCTDLLIFLQPYTTARKTTHLHNQERPKSVLGSSILL